MPRVGSSRQHRRRAGSPPSSTIASASRWRSPPERSRGWRSASAGEAGGLERLGRQLLRDALVQEVVARVLQQQRHAPGALDAAAGRREQPGGSRSSVDLPAPLRPISATRSPGRDARVDAAQIAGPRASSSQTPRARAPADGLARRRGDGARARGAASPRRRPPPSSSPRGAQRGARLLDADRRRAQAGDARTAARPASAARARARRPIEERRAARASQAIAPVVASRSRGRRRPGSARAGARRARPPCPTPG